MDQPLASIITESFEDVLARTAAETEALLDRLLERKNMPARRLVEAMRYATLGGGKRLRPFLVVESAALFSVPRRRALRVGAALECVHCYSLVHDDLPAMDDDDLRRGRPTVHKAWDEATAILVGDALLTEAFRLIAKAKALKPSRRVKATSILADAAGSIGMVGGQMLDLAAEGRYGKQPNGREENLALLETLASKKTGALIAGAAMLGAVAGGADRESRQSLGVYGKAIGLAFQIADDLLDETSTAAELGKATNKDVKRGKKTFPSILGRKEAKRQAEDLAARATIIASTFDNDGGAALAGIAQWAVSRRK